MQDGKKISRGWTYCFRELGAPSQEELSIGKFIKENCKTGIGHTRWATHGKVNLRNTHPIMGIHPDDGNAAYVVHNGIIENYVGLKTHLQSIGFLFDGETDTEVIAHLISHFSRLMHKPERMLEDVVKQLKGEYAFAALCEAYPGQLFLVANGSPLVVGMNGHVASDVSALVGYETSYFRLRDGETVVWGKAGDGKCRKWERVPEAPASVKSGAIESHMLREILEQPGLFRKFKSPPVYEGVKPRKVVMFGCGSSYNAALLGRHYFHDLTAYISAHVEYATELVPTRDYPFEKPWWIAITQSGETKDTLDVLKQIENSKRFVLTNNLYSEAARLASATPMECGPEQGVAATKTFTATCLGLMRTALQFTDYGYNFENLVAKDLADATDKLFARLDEIKAVASYVTDWHNILFLSRGMLWPIALEGALKMKEVAYKHAEAIHSSEMKHGPIALIDNNTLCVFLVTFQDREHLSKVLSNMSEVKARGGKIVAFADEATEAACKPLADRLCVLPSISAYVQPILMAVAMQLLSYYVAVHAGINPDRPKNLAKCVTV